MTTEVFTSQERGIAVAITAAGVFGVRCGLAPDGAAMVHVTSATDTGCCGSVSGALTALIDALGAA